MDVFAGLECRIDAKLNINKNIYSSLLDSVILYIQHRAGQLLIAPLIGLGSSDGKHLGSNGNRSSH